MIIMSKDTCVRINTEHILVIDYDSISEQLYAVVVNGQISLKVPLAVGIEESIAWMIINEISQREVFGDRVYKIESDQN